jgi:septum formation protein
MALWLAEQRLVLASKSAIRREMLLGAGIPVEVRPADIDERATEQRAASQAADAVATLLAREKARAVAAQLPGRLVLGADQVLAFGQQRFSKPGDRVAAREQLRALGGRTHQLHSAVALVRDETTLFEHCQTARLTMRAFSDQFLERYLDEVGPAVTASVGGYQLEKAGVQLFERVEGDHFVVLGLPLLALLRFLRDGGWLAA